MIVGYFDYHYSEENITPSFHITTSIVSPENLDVTSTNSKARGNALKHSLSIVYNMADFLGKTRG